MKIGSPVDYKAISTFSLCHLFLHLFVHLIRTLLQLLANNLHRQSCGLSSTPGCNSVRDCFSVLPCKPTNLNFKNQTNKKKKMQARNERMVKHPPPPPFKSSQARKKPPLTVNTCAVSRCKVHPCVHSMHKDCCSC